ncbi:methyltransferase domain-containing protein [Paracoccus sp. DMF-8]|uniref:class I SAM-dependent methyltransferase n=1 Tax=Paracoccus sp. DMF-8 TaxID=3019445 RepID=UPI0023E8F05E|nr:methyltransferase domain-containing protein [Paracoccus sp. DMF-8]MDF3604987.1 methyltransferase domain-containing protein [Paracoccus sp. DMF-8]
MERLNLSLPYSPTEFAIHSLRYLPLRGAVAGKRVLDIACGEGLGTALISNWGAERVVGVDIAADAISAARTRLADQGKAQVEFICADAIRYLEEVAEDFDLIISAETIEHLHDPCRFLELCRSRLAADGSLVVSCPNDPYYYGGGQTMNRYHLASYSFAAFKELAETVLGPGAWAFGAPLNGFGLFPQGSAAVTAGNYRDALARRRLLSGEMAPVPTGTKLGLIPENALFYLGIWGDLPLRGAYGVAIPFGSDHRLNDMRSVSDDISQGAVRRMALVHDSEVTTEEIAALRHLLRGKYDVSAVAWTGKAEALADAVLNGQVFDNIHFETPQAFDALADWVSGAALTQEDFDAARARWSAATLTLRPGLHVPSDHNLAFADGALGRAGALRHVRTAAGNMAVLWDPTAFDAETPAAVPPPLHRVGVVMPDDTDSDTVTALLAAARAEAGAEAGLPDLALCPITPGLTQAQIAAFLAETDALLCLDGSGMARRVAALAIRRGLAVILPVAHPLVPLLGDIQKPLIMARPDAAALGQALRALYHEPEARARIRTANLALAEHMATPARGVAWTWALALAQLACHRHGAPLRAAALKAAEQAARSVRLADLRAIEAERDALRAECERLRRQDRDRVE